MARKISTPWWIYAATVTAGAIFVATVATLVAILVSSPGGRYGREASGGGVENHGGGRDSSPITLRTPTTVRPSPAPSIPMITGDGIWDVLDHDLEQNGTTTAPRSVPTTTTTTDAEEVTPPTPTTGATPTAGSPPVATTAAPVLLATPAVTPAAVDNTTSSNNNNPATTATWYGIGDIPYSPEQADILSQQMLALPADAEFLIHVGDLRLSGANLPCKLSEYQDAANRLALSPAPVFVVLGDNDWTDCPDRAGGLKMWKQTFVGFESKHWNHTFVIERQTNRTENFAFVHKGTLFMGLNLVGGLRHSAVEWESRLTEQAEWTFDLIQRYQTTLQQQQQGSSTGPVGRIVIFGHANPNYLHNSYFVTLRTFIAQQLQNAIPILYLNGDKHEWSYDANYFGQPSFLRVMVSGKGLEPPIKVVVDSSTPHTDPVAAFVVDRRL